MLTKLKQIINRRADIAQRWFGIKDVESMKQFVYDDSDVQAELAKPEIRDAALKGSGPAGHRRDRGRHRHRQASQAFR
jgi:hypothetical protein